MKKQALSAVVVAVVGGALGAGCRDTTPPPPRVAVPAPGAVVREYPAPRPLDMPPPPPMGDGAPYADEALVVQPVPEQRAFIDAYNRVGRPRMTLFVNRNLEGDVAGLVGEPDKVERNEERDGRGVVKTYTKQEVTSRPPGTDELGNRQIDYTAVENIMSDWLAASGQTVLISPALARQRMSDEQWKDVQSGRPMAAGEVAQQLGADVLVNVSARVTRQTPQGPTVRMVAEAVNTRGGQSLGRAVVDVPPPLDKVQINRFTRFMARKLMDDMTSSWGAMASGMQAAPNAAPHSATPVQPVPPSSQIQPGTFPAEPQQPAQPTAPAPAQPQSAAPGPVQTDSVLRTNAGAAGAYVPPSPVQQQQQQRAAPGAR